MLENYNDDAIIAPNDRVVIQRHNALIIPNNHRHNWTINLIKRLARKPVINYNPYRWFDLLIVVCC